MIYANNATTSFPKPPCVLERVREDLVALPLTPGRGCAVGRDALQDCREALARLLNAPDPSRIILTPGATFGLNLALQGLLRGKRGGEALSTVLEHNAVIRPLELLKRETGLRVRYLSVADSLDLAAIEAALTPETRLVALTHCSNVTGDFLDIEAVSQLCQKHGIPLVVDACQSAGVLPLDVSRLSSKTILAFAGHKGLLGPRGTGALHIGADLDYDSLPPLIVGGTGIKSELREQPRMMPLYYEAGTSNVPGFAGLAAAVDYVLERGISDIALHKHRLIKSLISQIQGVPGLSYYLPMGENFAAGLLAFNLAARDPMEVGAAMMEKHGIITRAGLHCAPLLHEELGIPGTVRVSVGAFNTAEDIWAIALAIKALAEAT